VTVLSCSQRYSIPVTNYRLIFTTSQVRDGTSTDIEDYNAFVQSVADAAPVVGSWDLEWKALVSTSDVDARDNTGTNPIEDGEGLPIFRIDGERWVRDNFDLWGDGIDPIRSQQPFFSPLDITELGTPSEIPPGRDLFFFAYTGTNGNGQFWNPLGDDRFVTRY